MNEQELEIRMIEIEKRLTKMESLITARTTTKPLNNKYKGLAGGIRLMIDNGFFDSPKSLNEIIDELKREGYKLSVSGVASTLSTTFTNKQKTLTRVKDRDGWRYKKR